MSRNDVAQLLVAAALFVGRREVWAADQVAPHGDAGITPNTDAQESKAVRKVHVDLTGLTPDELGTLRCKISFKKPEDGQSAELYQGYFFIHHEEGATEKIVRHGVIRPGGVAMYSIPVGKGADPENYAVTVDQFFGQDEPTITFEYDRKNDGEKTEPRELVNVPVPMKVGEEKLTILFSLAGMEHGDAAGTSNVQSSRSE